METLSETRSHGGTQGVYRHASNATGTDMTFAVFVPEHAPGERLPVLWYLSGLTCTHANVMEKGEYREACAAQRVILVAPHTSPRGDDVPDFMQIQGVRELPGFWAPFASPLVTLLGIILIPTGVAAALEASMDLDAFCIVHGD